MAIVNCWYVWRPIAHHARRVAHHAGHFRRAVRHAAAVHPIKMVAVLTCTAVGGAGSHLGGLGWYGSPPPALVAPAPSYSGAEAFGAGFISGGSGVAGPLPELPLETGPITAPEFPVETPLPGGLPMTETPEPSSLMLLLSGLIALLVMRRGARSW